MRCKIKRRAGLGAAINNTKSEEPPAHVGEPFKNRTLQLSEGHELRYERLQAITPRDFEELLEKILRAVLVGRPLHVKLFLADYLDAELARRTFNDIVYGCQLKKSRKDPHYPTTSCICLGAALPQIEHMPEISECLNAFATGPIPLYEMKAPALDRYRQLMGIESLFDLHDGDDHKKEEIQYDEHPYVEGVSDSSLFGEETGEPLPTCGCTFCAMQAALTLKAVVGEFNVHKYQGVGCADYTWYPCYQYSSIPVPGCARKTPSPVDEERGKDGEKHHHKCGEKRKHGGGKHESVLYDVFGDTHLTQPEELAGEHFTVYQDIDNEFAEESFEHERLFTEPESSPPDEAFGPSFEQDVPFDDHLQPEHSQGEREFMMELVDVDVHMTHFVEHALEKGDPAEQDTSVDYSIMLPGGDQEDDDDDGTCSSASSHEHVTQDAPGGLPHIPTPAFEGPVNPEPTELQGEMTTVFGDEFPYDDKDVLFYDNPNYEPGEPFGPTFQEHEPFGGTLQPGYVYGEKEFDDEVGTNDEPFMQQVLDGSPSHEA